MNIKLKHLILIGIAIVVVATLVGKFIGPSTKLGAPSMGLLPQDMQAFVERLQNDSPLEAPIKIIGIQQYEKDATVFVRGQEKKTGMEKTIGVKIVLFNSGRWYSPQYHLFTDL